MSNILLPDDPDFDQPLLMGNPYTQNLTPKLKAEKWAADMDALRDKEPVGNFKYANSTIAYAPDPWVKLGQAGGTSNMMTQPMWFSPLHTPQNWQIASKRREIYQWCRFFYENEPKVGAAIDFYSRFPMNGFKLECKNRRILKFFEHKVVKKLKLNEIFKDISAEYYMLGDVFPHADILCEECHGSAVNQEGETCNHPGGLFNRIIILNPDWIEVQTTVLADEPAIVMVPDEELQRIVFYKQPKVVYDRIPEAVKKLVLARQPIPLSNRTVSHIKHMSVPYGTYGTSLIRRLFTTLAYKTKIMTANWIVAERLILPVRVVKIGSDQRPATSADIADIQQQLAATANDPNLTIVTHHNFEYEWYGASGKILQVTQEMEHIGKEILDGFMLNQSLLNGEMAGYSSAQVGVETLIRRLDSWRTSLAEWCYERIFLPIAEMQGFIDEEESEDVGDTIYLHPTIKWEDLNLKDKTQHYQFLNQLHDKQAISTQTLLEEAGFNYDQEVKRMRYEQMQGGAAGAMMGQPGGGMGGMGGGMPGAEGMPMGGDMGMGGGMGMGGPMDGSGMAPMGAPGMGPMASGGKVMKKGKSSDKQDDEQMQQQTQPVMLTSIEQKMAVMLEEVSDVLGIQKHSIRMQFPVQNPKGGKPYTLDFAFPNFKIGVETDGEIWHSSPDQIEDDKERDYMLATRGWTVLRFNDKSIEDAPQEVKSTVNTYLQAALNPKKSSNDDIKTGGIHLYTVINGKYIDLRSEYDKYIEKRGSVYIGDVLKPDKEYAIAGEHTLSARESGTFNQ